MKTLGLVGDEETESEEEDITTLFVPVDLYEILVTLLTLSVSGPTIYNVGEMRLRGTILGWPSKSLNWNMNLDQM